MSEPANQAASHGIAQLFRTLVRFDSLDTRSTARYPFFLGITNSISNFKEMDYEENNMFEIMHYEENRWKIPWFSRTMSLNMIIKNGSFLDASRKISQKLLVVRIFLIRWYLLRLKNQVLEPWRFKRTPGQSGILVKVKVRGSLWGSSLWGWYVWKGWYGW